MDEWETVKKSSGKKKEKNPIDVRVDISDETKLMQFFKTVKCTLPQKHNTATCLYFHNENDRRRDPFAVPYSVDESRNNKERCYHPDMFRTRMCRTKGCPFGKQICAFAHIASDLRIVKREGDDADTGPGLLEPDEGAGMNGVRDLETVPHFMCPISMEIMTDPVVTADGHSYDRHNIEEWLKTSSTSPATGRMLESTTLIPNDALKENILEWTLAMEQKAEAEDVERQDRLISMAAEVQRELASQGHEVEMPHPIGGYPHPKYHDQQTRSEEEWAERLAMWIYMQPQHTVTATGQLPAWPEFRRFKDTIHVKIKQFCADHPDKLTWLQDENPAKNAVEACLPQYMQKVVVPGGGPRGRAPTPPLQEIDKVFVGGLPADTTPAALKLHFSKYGEVLECKIMFNHHTGLSRGFGFVRFHTPKAARAASSDRWTTLNNKKIETKLFRPKAERFRPHHHNPLSLVRSTEEDSGDPVMRGAGEKRIEEAKDPEYESYEPGIEEVGKEAERLMAEAEEKARVEAELRIMQMMEEEAKHEAEAAQMDEIMRVEVERKTRELEEEERQRVLREAEERARLTGKNEEVTSPLLTGIAAVDLTKQPLTGSSLGGFPGQPPYSGGEFMSQSMFPGGMQQIGGMHMPFYMQETPGFMGGALGASHLGVPLRPHLSSPSKPRLNANAPAFKFTPSGGDPPVPFTQVATELSVDSAPEPGAEVGVAPESRGKVVMKQGLGQRNTTKTADEKVADSKASKNPPLSPVIGPTSPVAKKAAAEQEVEDILLGPILKQTSANSSQHSASQVTRITAPIATPAPAPVPTPAKPPASRVTPKPAPVASVSRAPVPSPLEQKKSERVEPIKPVIDPSETPALPSRPPQPKPKTPVVSAPTRPPAAPSSPAASPHSYRSSYARPGPRPSPEIDMKTIDKIFVGGLSMDTDERDLQEHYQKYGKVNECKIMVNHHTGTSRGFGFVQYASAEAAQAAASARYTIVNGKKVETRLAVPKPSYRTSNPSMRPSSSTNSPAPSKPAPAPRKDVPNAWARGSPGSATTVPAAILQQ